MTGRKLSLRMLESEKLDPVTQAIEALGIIFFTLDDIHELYFVRTIEVEWSHEELAAIL